jgi:FlaA1/EpsC-like NDP-sugar epimerase
VFLARGGEVFVTKMPTLAISDLAAVMIEEIAPRVGLDPEEVGTSVIGEKPGEKLYEELINNEETRRTIELDRYFVVLPAFMSVYGAPDYSYPGPQAGRVSSPYNSATSDRMTREEIRAFLRESRLLDEDDQGAEGSRTGGAAPIEAGALR